MALSKASLSRRFAFAAAVLAAAAVLLILIASLWLVNRQRASATQLLQEREVAFHAETVGSNLEVLAQRMAEVADSPILATGLVDSAGKETYLTPYLHGLRQINGIPMQVLFTDFEGKEIASNGNAHFNESDMAWLRSQIDIGRETSVIRDTPDGAQLIGVELLLYSRTSTPEGALMYKVRLADLKPAPSARIAWGPERASAAHERQTAGLISIPIASPPAFQHLALRLEENPHKLTAVLKDATPQYAVILLIAFALAVAVFLLGARLAVNITQDLRRLQGFSASLGDAGISARRADVNGSAEVSSLARSINRMLDRLYEQHVHLEDERQKFYQLANTIPQLAWIADADGNITWYNDRWYAYTGSTPEDMEGWGWQVVPHPDALPQLLERWKDSIATGKPLQMTFPMRGADGRYRHFFTTAVPLRDADGRIVQWFGTNTDVTQIEEAEKAVRRSEERLQQGLVAARMAVWDWDLATGRTTFSANLPSVFGQSWDNMSHAWDMVVPEDLPALRAAIDDAVQQRGEYHAVVRIRRPDETEAAWIEMRGRVDADGDTRETVHAIAVDITERKRAEEALRMADRRKDEFLAMLAHELRNPLAPIASAAELLRLVYASEPRVRETSSIISRQVEHMTRLVDDLLDVSRVTRGLVVLDRQTLDLRDIATEAVEQTRPLIEARHHQLEMTLPAQPAWIDGDQTRLVQVVANLLNNATKYTSEGGQLGLVVETDGTTATLRVRDNGAGISPDLMPDIFELFSQGKRTLDRSQGGLGLGLALVKRLVELHGGSVSAISEGPGRGSEFTIRLPLHVAAARPAVQPAQAAPQARAATGVLRILVVDDNADAANSLAMLLKAGGHQVDIEYTATGGLQRAADEAFDVLMLDIGLPDMDGYELARRMKVMPHLAHSILVAVTGYGQAQDVAMSREAGFAEHMVKPVNGARLSALMDRLRRTASAAEANPAMAPDR